MAFAVAFLIAAIIGLVIADGVSSITNDELEEFKREDEDE